MNKIRKGDEVIVIAGRDKGRRGTVISVAGEHVVVESINVVKRHTRPNPPLAISNVQLWNPVTKKGDRVGFRTLADGRKVRFFKSNKEVVDA
jgi:large subunit ribosomal protein L24